MTAAAPNTEQLFRLISEVIREYSVILLDADGIIVSWTVAAEQIEGFSADEILGEPIARLWPEDPRIDAEAALAEAAREGTTTVEGWRSRPDHSRFFAHALISAVRNEQGELTGSIRILRDETARRIVEEQLLRSEQRFRSLVENSSDILALVDRDAIVHYISPAIQRVIGYTDDELLQRGVPVLPNARFLGKPFTPAQLLEAVDQVVRGMGT